MVGTTSGIGKETARVFAKKGAHVIMAVRNTKLGEEMKHKFLEETPNAIVDVMPLDLSSLASIRKFVEDFNARNLPLNILMYVFTKCLQIIPFFLMTFLVFLCLFDLTKLLNH
jgi:NAD(P)-dependent dehydrogenase (short-subunit alcohol dehydrogenase family)